MVSNLARRPAFETDFTRFPQSLYAHFVKLSLSGARPYPSTLFPIHYSLTVGPWGSVVVRALRYKSVRPGIDSKR